MELDQLLDHWNVLDQKIERVLTRQATLERALAVESTRRRLRFESIRPAIDVGFAVILILASGSCLGSHQEEPSLAIPAVILLLASILFLIDNVRQLHILSSLRWDGSIVSNQAFLGRLRHARIRQLRWILLLAPMIGLCLLSVGAMQFFGVNAWGIMTRINPTWAWSNVGFAVLFTPSGFWLSRAISRRWQGNPRINQVLDHLSGANLAWSRREIDQWAEIEQKSVD